MKESKGIGSAGTLIALSILMMLSGMVAMVSADGAAPLPNEFYGTVTLNGADAPVGTVINAYSDGESIGTIEVTTAGKYGEMPGLNYLKVNGNDGEIISFTIGAETVDQTVRWSTGELPRELNLWIGERPAADEGASHTDADDTSPTDTQDASQDGATGSAPTGSDSDEALKPGPVPDVTISASEENVTSAPSSIPTTQTTASPSTSIKKPGEESEEGFLPGFEAMFAIAGFLAVVYLVRRRR
jgi:PGF-CTERM protein